MFTLVLAARPSSECHAVTSKLRQCGFQVLKPSLSCPAWWKKALCANTSCGHQITKLLGWPEGAQKQNGVANQRSHSISDTVWLRPLPFRGDLQVCFQACLINAIGIIQGSFFAVALEHELFGCVQVVWAGKLDERQTLSGFRGPVLCNLFGQSSL